MKGIFPIDKFRTLQTPFYYYDTKVLRDTLSAINQEVAKYPSYSVHYAVKANANPKVLTIIRESGMGADCVSGGEIRAAVRAGFPANKIVFAGVWKSSTNWLPLKIRSLMSLSVSIRMSGRIRTPISPPVWLKTNSVSVCRTWTG